VAIRRECIPLTKPGGKGRECRIVPRTMSGEKPRVIELDTQTIAVLKTWEAKQDRERELVGASCDDHGLICRRPDGRLTTPRRSPRPSTVASHRSRLPDCPNSSP
jgi:hypothetical protein